MQHIDLTDEQQYLIKEAVKWYKHSSDQVFQYTAPAGAGKSTVMHCIIDALGIKYSQVAPMAFTGTASLVMRLNGFENACTIHSWMYRLETEEVTVNDEVHYRKKFVFAPLDKRQFKLICIDEASMVPLHMKKDIEKNGIKIIACGDLNQLPPVADNPGFLFSGKIYRLTKIMRQSKYSSIVEISNMLRNGIEPRIGNYGQVLVIPRDSLNDEMIKSAKTILCGTNKTREALNTYIRQNIFHFDSPLPHHGEKIVCRKNNWNVEEDGINIANGMTGTVQNDPSISGYKNKSFSLDFTPDLFPYITFNNLRCDYEYFLAPPDVRRRMKSLNYSKMNYLEKFEFAYAITTHLSQGSQFYTGIYIEENMGRDIQNKLNYTGITRFVNFCIYVLPIKRVYIPVDGLKKSIISINGDPVI